MKAYFQKFSLTEFSHRIQCFHQHVQGNPVITQPHWHPELELHLVTKGNATFQICENQFLAHEGDIVVVNKDQLHGVYGAQSERVSLLVLIFDFDYIASVPKEDPVFFSKVLFNNPMSADITGYQEIVKRIWDIYDEYTSDEEGHLLLLQGMLLELCGLLARTRAYRLEEKISTGSQRSKSLIENTFQLIETSYSERLSLEMAAGASNISVPHFCRIFKSTTGMTFNDYLSHFRVRKATVLLKEDFTIQQVSDMCGFGSASSMIRCFRKFTQSTPQAARAQS